MTAYKVTCYHEYWVDDWTDSGYKDETVMKEEYFETKQDAYTRKSVLERKLLPKGEFSRVEVTKITIKMRKRGKANEVHEERH